tara:strand:- start:4977 stop:6254 length:1278 start_codon:yes stop_codon:yes gene_type:complete
MKTQNTNQVTTKPQESVRGTNRATLLKLASHHPDIDRTLMAELAGLTTPAITRISQELIRADLLSESGSQKSTGRGRKRQSLRLNSSGGYVLGISILAFNTGVTLCNLAGDIIAHETVTASDLTNPASTLDEIAKTVNEMITENILDPRRMIGVGAAIAGYLDASGEILMQSPYLGWPEFNIKRSLEARLKLPVAIENVNRAIIIAETNIGITRGAKDVVLIRAALGLGGAMISNNKLCHGHTNIAGQIGHIPAKLDGKRCSCGKIGCLTTEASGFAILQHLGLSLNTDNGLEDVQYHGDALRSVLNKAKTDPLTSNAISEAATSLGFHSAAPILMFNPETVILTGPLGRNPIYYQAFKQQLQASGVKADIKGGQQDEIKQPSEAAAGLALSEHFFSPSLDLDPLIEATESNSIHYTSDEGVIIL